MGIPRRGKVVCISCMLVVTEKREWIRCKETKCLQGNHGLWCRSLSQSSPPEFLPLCLLSSLIPAGVQTLSTLNLFSTSSAPCSAARLPLGGLWPPPIGSSCLYLGPLSWWSRKVEAWTVRGIASLSGPEPLGNLGLGPSISKHFPFDYACAILILLLYCQ